MSHPPRMKIVQESWKATPIRCFMTIREWRIAVSLRWFETMAIKNHGRQQRMTCGDHIYLEKRWTVLGLVIFASAWNNQKTTKQIKAFLRAFLAVFSIDFMRHVLEKGKYSRSSCSCRSPHWETSSKRNDARTSSTCSRFSKHAKGAMVWGYWGDSAWLC